MTNSGEQPEPSLRNKSVTVRTTVHPDTTLCRYNMTDSPDQITLGTGDVTYTVTTFNYSTSQAPRVVLNDTISGGTTFVPATTPNGGVTSAESPGTVACTAACHTTGTHYRPTNQS